MYHKKGNVLELFILTSYELTLNIDKFGGLLENSDGVMKTTTGTTIY